MRWYATGTRALAHRLIPLAGSLLITAAVLSACSEQRSPTRHVVEIRSFVFDPDTLHVGVGDTVVWVNRDVVPHTATGGGSGWDSGTISTEATWTLVADSVGAATYICTIHPSMMGWIHVR